jgi:hypothetical protein
MPCKNTREIIRHRTYEQDHLGNKYIFRAGPILGCRIMLSDKEYLYDRPGMILISIAPLIVLPFFSDVLETKIKLP